MRSIAIFALAVASFAMSAQAGRLTPAEALSSALDSWQSTDGRRRAPSSYKLAWSAPGGGVHVFNRDGGGFVIAAGDDTAGAALLGYCDTGEIKIGRAHV